MQQPPLRKTAGKGCDGSLRCTGLTGPDREYHGGWIVLARAARPPLARQTCAIAA